MFKQSYSFCFVALVYYLAGQFGLLLAIPPGFSSSVWPAAGVALACLLKLRHLPTLYGVAFGSFCLNLGVASNSYSNVTSASLFTAFFISLGAALQTYVCYLLYKRYIHSQYLLDTPTDIARFTFLVSPVGALVSTSIGTTVLLFSGLIPFSAYSFSWITWWVGDYIGLLFFTPFILILYSGDSKLEGLRRWQITLPISVLFLSVLFLFSFSKNSRIEAVNYEIKEASNIYVDRVIENLNLAETKLRAYGAFFHSNNGVAEAEFQEFSKYLLDTDNGFLSVYWLETSEETVPHASVEHISENGLNYDTRYIFNRHRVKEFGHSSSYSLNDLFNQIKLKKILKDARDSGRSLISEPLKLKDKQNDSGLVAMFFPVYDARFKQPIHGLDVNTGFFKGFFAGLISVDETLGPLVAGAKSLDYGISILDVSDPQRRIPLVLSEQVPSRYYEGVEKHFSLGGRSYVINFFASEHYKFTSNDWGSWSVLTVGFLFSSVLQLFMLTITGTNEKIRREVAKKTIALTLAKQQAEKASQYKSEYLSSMSHELRTPLHAILGFNHLCMETSLDEEQRDLLTKSQLASKTLLSLIDQTLDHAKIEAGKIEIQSLEFDFPELLRKVRNIISGLAEQKALVFHYSVPSNLPQYLIGDPLRLEQVLLNLCGNAIKFTEKGRVELLATVQQLNAECVLVEFAIRDTGIGISDEDQEKLFESFQQLDNGPQKFGGNGLGLAISRQLVELMGGKIQLHSVQGEGSCFTVQLSMVKGRKSFNCTDNHRNLSDYIDKIERREWQDKPFGLSFGQKVSNDKPLDGYSILVVEDMALNQQVAQRLLENLGALVRVVGSGMEAIELLESNSAYDLILMDIQMPEMNGYEATKLIKGRKEFCHIPIVAMTAYASEEDIRQSIDAQMDAHIAKPFILDDVIKILEKFLPQKNLSPKTL